MVNKSKVSDVQITHIITLYKNGVSQNHIAKEIGVCQQTICKILHKNNINCVGRKYRKHNINEEFFDRWSHEMAYILGFISADGGINNYTLTINLSKRDKEILLFITKHIGDVELEDRPKYKSIRIRFNSIKLIDSLKKHGITTNKTSKIRIPSTIPDQYIGDYVRGIFDGDGWVSYKKGRKGLSFGICSASKGFVEDIQRLCGGIGKIRIRSYKKDPKRKTQFYFENTKNEDAIKFRSLIYSDEIEFSLTRKRIKFFSRLKEY